MLEPIADLPAGIVGVRASAEVSKDDYDNVIVPLLAEAKREGRRVRFLFHIGAEFQRFTPSAALEDARIGMQYERTFERLAVVSDLDWVKAAATFTSTIAPCPVRMFANAQLQKAAEWLSERTKIPAVTLPYTVGGTPEAKDLFSFFDDTINRLLKARKPV